MTPTELEALLKDWEIAAATSNHGPGSLMRVYVSAAKELIQTIRNQQAKVEWTRKEWAETQTQLEKAQCKLEEQQAEIERLRALAQIAWTVDIEDISTETADKLNALGAFQPYKPGRSV